MSCSLNRKDLYVIFPAAGSGSRMKSSTNKLFMEVDGITVLERTLIAFSRFSELLGIRLHGVIATSEDLIDDIKDIVSNNDSYSYIEKIVLGSDTRAKSVNNGVQALALLQNPPKDNSPVFIHDMARCLIDSKTLKNCLDSLEECDVSVAAVKAKNTIKLLRADGITIDKTLDRDFLYEAQTPQNFRYSALTDCFSKTVGTNPDTRCTDDVSLAEMCGYDVKIAEGAYSNIKITTPEDINLALSLIGN